VEVFLLNPVSGDRKTWQALVHPGRKMRTGERVRFGERLEAEVVARGAYGERTVRFECEGDIHERLEEIGHVPLPPYIKRPDAPEDRLRYQTVFAKESGSVAAPTAGLHFTPEILEECRVAGAEIARVTLHVGWGPSSRFTPMSSKVIACTRSASRSPKRTPGRCGLPHGWSRSEPRPSVLSKRPCAARALAESHGETDLFIYPGFEFKAAGALLTNFHLPRSSLLLLVCAFAGRDFVLAAYRHAVEAGYRSIPTATAC